MKFKLDENMPADMSRVLKDAGHDAETVYDEQLAGAKDPEVFKVAVNEKRILMTLDLDFADIRAYPIGTHSGIIVFRLSDQRWETLRSVVEEIIERMNFDDLEGVLAIVEPGRVRFRR